MRQTLSTIVVFGLLAGWAASARSETGPKQVSERL